MFQLIVYIIPTLTDQIFHHFAKIRLTSMFFFQKYLTFFVSNRFNFEPFAIVEVNNLSGYTSRIVYSEETLNRGCCINFYWTSG